MLANKSDPDTVARLCKQVTRKPLYFKFYLQREYLTVCKVPIFRIAVDTFVTV